MTHASPTSDHESIVALLPWYVNETLDDGERELVRSHVEKCPACRSDIDMLVQLQKSVRRDSPSPIVPSPRIEDLLETLDDKTRGRRLLSWPTLAIAASVIVASAVLLLLTADREAANTTVSEYETVTSESGSGPLDYVIELTFVPGTDSAARNALFDEYNFVGATAGVDSDTYRVTVSLDAPSLKELERYVDAVETSPMVTLARVVAVQLPVE